MWSTDVKRKSVAWKTVTFNERTNTPRLWVLEAAWMWSSHLQGQFRFRNSFWREDRLQLFYFFKGIFINLRPRAVTEDCVVHLIPFCAGLNSLAAFCIIKSLVSDEDVWVGKEESAASMLFPWGITAVKGDRIGGISGVIWLSPCLGQHPLQDILVQCLSHLALKFCKDWSSLTSVD